MPIGRTIQKKETAPTLESRVCLLATAKAAEERAKAHRIEAEEEVAAMIEGPEVGQKTVALADGTKVTVTRGYNYKADCEEIATFFKREQLDTPAPIKHKATITLDPAGYEWYRAHNPAVFDAISRNVVVTPKKVSVVLKAAKVEA